MFFRHPETIKSLTFFSLIFAGKAGAYPSGASYRTQLQELATG
jgi:hypothetical protein